MLFYLSILSFCILTLAGSVHYRQRILPLLPQRLQSALPRLPWTHPSNSGYARVPTTFAEQRAGGLSGANFDLEANIEGGDSRMGLDEAGSREVMEIMRTQGVNFDEARLIRQHRVMARHGIDPSGMPLDSKAVTRL